MKRNWCLVLIGITCISLMVGYNTIWAKSDGKLVVDHMKNKQAPVTVDVDKHKAAGISCQDCHHAADEKKQDAKDKACKECHHKAGEEVPAVTKIVYHQVCTECHKAQKKENKPTGPTMCNECHKKE